MRRHPGHPREASGPALGVAFSPHGCLLPLHGVRFAGRYRLRSQDHGPITLALGQRVVLGNQFLL